MDLLVNPRMLLVCTIGLASSVAVSSDGFSQSMLESNWICQRFGQPPTPAGDHVSLRMFPLGWATVGIKRTNASLLQSIETLDLLAIRAESLMRQMSQQDTPADERTKHLYLSEAAANTIVCVRGTRFVAFPRVFLLHPSFARLRVQAGDFIGTVSLQNPDLNSTDPLYVHLRESLGYSLEGPQSKPGTVWVRNQLGNSSSQYELGSQAKLGLKQFVEQNWVPLPAQELALKSAFVVHAIRRQQDGLDYWLIYPDRNCGVMGWNGVLFQSFFQQKFEEDVWQDEWDRVFKDHDLQLSAGDQLWTTTAELLHSTLMITNQVQLGSPLGNVRR